MSYDTEHQTIFVLTSHVMLPGFRKTSLHFVVEEWARSGHRVYFTTVGYSALSRLKSDPRYAALRLHQANRYVETAPNIYCGAHLPLAHAFSSGCAWLSGLEKHLFRLYGNHLPDFMAARVKAADIVVLESGTPLAFYHRIKATNPSARIVYYCRDLLTTIGASKALLESEQQVVVGADLVVVPSQNIGERFAKYRTAHLVPQGVDPALLRDIRPNPYMPNTKNGLVVGDMLFDVNAVAACAAANPDVFIHLFGIKWTGSDLANIVSHGEVAFDALIPYLQHANFGFAPYAAGPNEVYLADSSLKLLQYAACLLPVILPHNIPGSRGNEIRYSVPSERNWKAVMAAALSRQKDSRWLEGILNWPEVAQETLRPLIGSPTRPDQQEKSITAGSDAGTALDPASRSRLKSARPSNA